MFRYAQFLTTAAAFVLVVACRGKPPTDAAGTPPDAPLEAGEITSSEMLSILRNEEIESVVTIHANDIWVKTKQGRRVHTIWHPAPPYEHIEDSLNIVVQILKVERGLESGKDFALACE